MPQPFISDWESVTSCKLQKQLYCEAYVEYCIAIDLDDVKTFQHCSNVMRELTFAWDLPQERLGAWQIECVASMYATCVALNTSQLRMHF